MNKKDIKFLAYYLPQFHCIPENNKWWGEGFTEWTNVKKAKPLFKNHYQPIVPGELGYYDLLQQPEIQEKQSELALTNGVDGFIYYQYWFGDGKMLLKKPAEKMLENKSINIPFCFCWANETWKGIWHGLDNPEVLIEQTYKGEKDYEAYFNYLLPFFKDSRYIVLNNKPMFHIYKINDIPDLKIFIEVFNRLAIEEGFDGIYLVSTATTSEDLKLNYLNVDGQVGLDVFFKMRYNKPSFFPGKSFFGKVESKLKTLIWPSGGINERKKPLIFDYVKGVSNFNVKFLNKKYIPCVFPNWDNSARSGKKSLIFKNATPINWKKHLETAVQELKNNPENPQFIIIKSWNEWAEGNYLEPDEKFGLEWLEVIKEVKEKINN